MAQRLRLLLVLGSWLLAISCLFNERAIAQTIWTGFTKSFSKAAGADETLPASQDVLAPTVKLTRSQSAGGLINIAAESFYDSSSSPALTLWATDLNNAGKTIAATNYQDLAFTNWINAYGMNHSAGGFIEGRNAVVKIPSLNLYLDLKFTSWESGAGGGVAYLRAEPPAPGPTGDYNGNGFVDAADYVLWRHTFGQMGISNGSGADGNSNGQIDEGDYTFWRERFGNPASGSGLGEVATVPEPSAAISAIHCFGLLLATRFVRRRRSGCC